MAANTPTIASLGDCPRHCVFTVINGTGTFVIGGRSCVPRHLRSGPGEQNRPPLMATEGGDPATLSGTSTGGKDLPTHSSRGHGAPIPRERSAPGRGEPTPRPTGTTATAPDYQHLDLAEIYASLEDDVKAEPTYLVSRLPRPIARLAGCFNCGHDDHRYSQCPEPSRRIFCYRCGEPGSTLRTCVQCHREWRILVAKYPEHLRRGGRE